MRQIPRYRMNLLHQYRQLMLGFTVGIGLLAVFVVLGVVASFARYRRATERAFVFHPGGAAISIYDGQGQPTALPLTPRRTP